MTWDELIERLRNLLRAIGGGTIEFGEPGA